MTTSRTVWIPYDSEAKGANPLPEPGVWVWVHDEFYDGVTLGYWDNGWWVTLDHKDDCGITHWHPLVKPEAPGSEGNKG